MSKTDYIVYMRFLKEYLTPKENVINDLMKSKKLSDVVMQRIYHLYRLKNYSEKIKLISYCLMPNHVHLELYQKESNAISEFLQSLHTRYSRYFNKTYQRVGTLFQERYKYTYIGSDKEMLQVSRYIHLNPSIITPQYKTYPWTSFKFYRRKSNSLWIHTDLLKKAYFESGLSKQYKSYTDFVEAGL